MRRNAIFLFALTVACRSTPNDRADDPAGFVRDACPVTALPASPPNDLLIGVSRTEIPRRASA